MKTSIFKATNYDKELYDRFVSQLAGKNPVDKVEELIRDFLGSDLPF